MPLVVVATPGASDANSYTTVAEFNSYLETRLHIPTSVEDSTSTDRGKAVVSATRMINADLCWTGAASSATQALPWPRTGMVGKNGAPIDSAVIPPELKNMTNELAFLLLQRDRSAESDAQVQGLKKLVAGPVSLEFKDEGATILAVPASVTNLGVPSWYCASVDNLNESFFQVL